MGTKPITNVESLFSYTQNRLCMVIKSVVCFDRDLTIDINPPENKESVPLSLVKYLAHQVSTVDVWATGNRHLWNIKAKTSLFRRGYSRH